MRGTGELSEPPERVLPAPRWGKKGETRDRRVVRAARESSAGPALWAMMRRAGSAGCPSRQRESADPAQLGKKGARPLSLGRRREMRVPASRCMSNG